MSEQIPRTLREAASRQSGVITRRQALESGVSPRTIEWKLTTRAWQPVYRGVYTTFTGPLARSARLWAAVLYAGRGAYLSHDTAAELGRLTDGPSKLIHVTIPASRRVIPPAGVVVHISSRAAMVWRPFGSPPFTLAEETVIDLIHAAEDLNDVVALVTAGFGRRLLRESDLRWVALDHKKLSWRRELDEIISVATGGAHSVLEYRYDRDVERAHGLPVARRQVPFTKPDGSRGFRDRYYDAHALVVELDGKRFHDDRRDHDRRRDNDAVAETGATLRYTWDDVTRTPCATAAQVHAVLRSRGYPGTLKPCSPRCRAVPARAAS